MFVIVLAYRDDSFLPFDAVERYGWVVGEVECHQMVVCAGEAGESRVGREVEFPQLVVLAVECGELVVLRKVDFFHCAVGELEVVEQRIGGHVHCGQLRVERAEQFCQFRIVGRVEVCEVVERAGELAELRVLGYVEGSQSAFAAVQLIQFGIAGKVEFPYSQPVA